MSDPLPEYRRSFKHIAVEKHDDICENILDKKLHVVSAYSLYFRENKMFC